MVRPWAMFYDGTTYFYQLNLQGDVIGIVDTTGASVAKYAYDAWGKVVYSTGSMATANPIRYRGYYYDAELETYYLQSRYYDPATKRFINADGFVSTGHGFLGYNMFVYCNNNPVNRSDPSGNLPDWVYKYFGTERNYYDYVREYGYDDIMAPLDALGINKRDYHVPTNAVNVNVTIKHGTTNRTISDVAIDRIPNGIKNAVCNILTELAFGPGAEVANFIDELYDISNEIPGIGEYKNFILIVEYDKADEVSGELIYFIELQHIYWLVIQTERNICIEISQHIMRILPL